MRTLITLYLLVASTAAYTQSLTRGKVIDEITKEPLPGVEVKIEGVNGRLVTNREGEFELPSTLPTKAHLSLSLTGYIEQKATVDTDRPVLITMPIDIFFWSEMVIVIDIPPAKKIKIP